MIWPFKHGSKLLEVRSTPLANSHVRPIALSEAGPSWGPLSLSGLDNMHRGDLFYAFVGLLVFLFTWPSDNDAKTLEAGWIIRVLARNLLLEVSLYELWHQMLYGRLANENVKAHKYNEKDPYTNASFLWRERLATTSGFVWSTAYEVLIVHLWASQTILPCPVDQDLSFASFGGCQLADPTFNDLTARPLSLVWFLLMFPLTTQMRGVHFFSVHRCMHPWWDRKNGLKDGDIGAFLYRYVHSFHHKSYNPGPWSSLCMHPVEHFFYFSCFLLALVVPTHPLHLLLNKFHTDISALPGHDGYGPPVGADDVGHYLHHAHYECNFGFSFPNYLDKFFGTYEDGSKFTKKK
jgi:hypothetical protein